MRIQFFSGVAKIESMIRRREYLIPVKMSRRSPRLALRNASSVTITTPPTDSTYDSVQDTHFQCVMRYYMRVLETVRNPTERIDATIAAFEFIFQNWPQISTESWKSTISQSMIEIEGAMADMNDVQLCKKLRLTLLFHELRLLLA